MIARMVCMVVVPIVFVMATEIMVRTTIQAHSFHSHSCRQADVKRALKATWSQTEQERERERERPKDRERERERERASECGSESERAAAVDGLISPGS